MFSQVSARARLKLKTSEPNTWLKISSSTSPTSISPSSGPTNSKTARNLRLLSDILCSPKKERERVLHNSIATHVLQCRGGSLSRWTETYPASVSLATDLSANTLWLTYLEYLSTLTTLQMLWETWYEFTDCNIEKTARMKLSIWTETAILWIQQKSSDMLPMPHLLLNQT